LGVGKINTLAYHLPLVVVTTVVVVSAVVVTVVVVGAVVVTVVMTLVVVGAVVVAISTLRAKPTPNGTQKAATAKTLMTIPTISQNSLRLFLLFSIGSSSHTDTCILF
jgi:hypothetical protein